MNKLTILFLLAFIFSNTACFEKCADGYEKKNMFASCTAKTGTQSSGSNAGTNNPSSGAPIGTPSPATPVSGGTSSSTNIVIPIDPSSQPFHFTIQSLGEKYSTTQTSPSFPNSGSPTIDTSNPVTNIATPPSFTAIKRSPLGPLGTPSINTTSVIDQLANSRSLDVLSTIGATSCTSLFSLNCVINSINNKLLNLTNIITSSFTSATNSITLSINDGTLSIPTVINKIIQSQDLPQNSGLRYAREAVALGGYIYFNSSYNVFGIDTSALLRVNLSNFQTNLVFIPNSTNGSGPEVSRLTAYNGAIYFRAKKNHADTTYYFMKYDPTTDTVSQVSSNTALLNPTAFIVYNNSMYFYANNAAGYSKLFKMSPNGNIKQLTNLCPSNDEAGLVFKATDSVLYASITPQGSCGASTKQFTISRINTDDSIVPLFFYDSNSQSLVDDGLISAITYSGTHYFVAGNIDKVLYVDNGDGTISRPQTMSWTDDPSAFGIKQMAVANGYIYFSTGSSVSKYSPVDNVVTSIHLPNVSPNIPYFFEVNGKIYIVALNSSSQYKLYKVDASDNVIQISDIYSGGSDTVKWAYKYNNEIYMLAQKSNGIYKLFKMTANEEIHQVGDINSGGTDFNTSGNNYLLLSTQAGLFYSSDIWDWVYVIQ